MLRENAGMALLLSATEEIIEDFMKEFRVGRNSAVTFLVKTFEYALRHGDTPEAQKALKAHVQQAVANGESWAIEYLSAHYRVNIPSWGVLYDEAKDRGFDPVTYISMTSSVLPEVARGMASAVEKFRSGVGVDEIVRSTQKALEALPLAKNDKQKG